MRVIVLVPSKSYEDESPETKAERFKIAKILVVVLGVYLLAVTGFQEQWQTEQRVSFVLMLVMLAILCMPALIPVS
jgi:cell division protein FtsW (lipid II flippase)